MFDGDLVSDIVNGCGLYKGKNSGLYYFLRVPDVSDYSAYEKSTLIGNNGEHCLLDHGHDVLDEALIFRKTDGFSPSGRQGFIDGISSKFEDSGAVKMSLEEVGPGTSKFINQRDLAVANNQSFFDVTASFSPATTPSLGHGYILDSNGEALLIENLYSVKARYVIKSDGTIYLSTMYPIN